MLAVFNPLTIHILSKTFRLAMIRTQLITLGLDVMSDHQLDRASLERDSGYNVIFVDLFAINIDDAHTQINNHYLKNANLPPPIIIVLGATRDHAKQLDADIYMEADHELLFTRKRLSRTIRMRIQRSESDLRRITAENFVNISTLPQISLPKKLLYIGEVSPSFICLKHNIESYGYEIVVAFSTYTALDNLKQEYFGAILIDNPIDIEQAQAFYEQIQRIPHLSDLPVHMLTHAYDAKELNIDILDNIPDLIEKTDFPDDIVDRIVSCIAERQAAIPLSPSNLPMGKGQDAASGLFTKEFFYSHLERQINHARQWRQPLSLLTLKLDICSNEAKANIAAIRARILCSAARLLQSVIRIEDVATMLDCSTLCISMPGVQYENACHAAQRIAKLVNATNVNQELGAKNNVQFDMIWRVAKLRPEYTTDTLIAAAISGQYYRDQAA